jgi:eukaryotic-like serine/threonine-protein kinase
MTMPTQGQGAGLAPGTLISGRFEVEAFATTVGPVAVWSAKDKKVARTAALWMFSNHNLTPDQVEAARKSIRTAASVAHKDLVVPFGSAVTADGSLCVATEPVPVTSLSEVLDQKRASGTFFSLSQAFPYIAKLVEILHGNVHPNLAHGAIAPATVRFDGGHIRLAGFGMLLPLATTGAIPAHAIAPEVRAGAEPTPQSDIYAVGALLYELLTGQPANPDVPVSSLIPGTPATLDVLLDECLAQQPHERLESLVALKGGLASILGPLADIVRDDGDIDIPIELSERPSTMSFTLPPGAFDDPPAGERPQTLPPGLLIESNTIAPGQGPISPMAARPIAPKAARPSIPAGDADLGSLLKAATKNDSDRWMFAHEGLDHGPMTARDLIAAIVRGDVLDTDAVTNMDTSEKKPLSQWHQYREFAETAADKRRNEARKAATQEALADSGVARASKMWIAGASVLAFLMVGVVFYKTLGPGARKQRSAAEIDDLVQRGELRVQTQSVTLLPPPPPSARRHGGGGGGGFTSYEAAMSAPIDFNFGAAGGAGGGTLSDAEITRPLTSNLSRFAGCLSDGSARNVTLRLAIGGNGHAAGVTVVNGSAGLKSCVSGVVRSLSWRSFGGPRIGLSWGFGF